MQWSTRQPGTIDDQTGQQLAPQTLTRQNRRQTVNAYAIIGGVVGLLAGPGGLMIGAAVGVIAARELASD